MAIDKATLLATRKVETEEVELPQLGGTVRVRALTRSEALQVRGTLRSEEEQERVLLAVAMVEPTMTEDEIGEWQAAAPAGELQPVAAAILRLSGLTQTAVKDAMRTFRD